MILLKFHHIVSFYTLFSISLNDHIHKIWENESRAVGPSSYHGKRARVKGGSQTDNKV